MEQSIGILSSTKYSSATKSSLGHIYCIKTTQIILWLWETQCNQVQL